MSHKCHNYAWSDYIGYILKSIARSFCHVQCLSILIFAEQVAEERQRPKKRAKGKGVERGEIETKPEEKEEEDEEAPRRGNWVDHIKKPRQVLQVCVTGSYCSTFLLST